MKYVYWLALVLLIGSCNNSSTDNAQSTGQQPAPITIEGLTLNNGEKWIANEETEEGMQAMKQQITNFTTSDVEAFHTLGNKLSSIKDEIIAKCDMEGTPHDQLHLVLLPMLEQIKKLQQTETQETGNDALYKLEYLLELYFKHFTI